MSAVNGPKYKYDFLDLFLAIKMSVKLTTLLPFQNKSQLLLSSGQATLRVSRRISHFVPMLKGEILKF